MNWYRRLRRHLRRCSLAYALIDATPGLPWDLAWATVLRVEAEEENPR